MDSVRLIRAALLVSIVCGALVSPAGVPWAATPSEFVDPHPAPGNQFGQIVVALSTGNVVITSSLDDAGGTDAGAVYLFNGATGALISTLRGSSPGDRVGFQGIVPLANGNYVIRTVLWDNGAIADVGAVTWGSGTTGVSGVVSAANSLVGSTASDLIGGTDVTPLPNGNYVVRSMSWDNGGVVDAGSATWGNGTTGIAGPISAANSLVGSTSDDQAGSIGITVLTNGNYVIRSPLWNNGAIADAGAVTWGNGTTGISGAISAANSLVGSTASDQVGNNVATALTNGNYVVSSTFWNNGAVVDAGAATWGSGATGISGVVSAANSLVGSTANDNVGFTTPLTNGNYVARTSNWDNGAVADAGAATWGSGTTGVKGVISAANSLVGTTAGDNVSNGSTVALTNGNYVVRSTVWNNGAALDAGAATWGNGTTGVSGVVSAANSLVGSTTNDLLSTTGVAFLANGNYVVVSSSWSNGAVLDVGAATWGDGSTGVTGVVSAANSLIGSTASDAVGNGGATALTNGNYVVRSHGWRNGGVSAAGAATWGSGTSGVTGAVSAANSLVGSSSNDAVGQSGVAVLANGNYVVASGTWDNGALADAGAATWGSGTSGVVGVITAGNSLVGSAAGDLVGGGGVVALTNGNYVVRSPNWINGTAGNAGAVTWGNGSSGVTGVLSLANSLVGSKLNDQVGFVTALTNGNYVIRTAGWDNGALVTAGAVTWGSGTIGVTGVISASNSLVGTAASTGLNTVVEDVVNDTFLARFLTEGGGRVRIGPLDFGPVILSVVDIPADQGGWLRLTFSGSTLDQSAAATRIAAYGVWRRVPEILAGGAGYANREQRLDPAESEHLRAAVPTGLDLREVDGRFYVTGPRQPTAGIATVFPDGIWEYVASVPALQQAQYVVAVPTLSNAAPNDFVVTAHTTEPSIWYVTNPASGQSVDNLAPAAPSPFTAAYTGGATHLHWGENSEPDLGVYNLYRGATAGFTPTPANRISSSSDTGAVDAGTAGSYYKLSAVDVNGNESGFALITPASTVGVGDGLPVAFALDGVWPNPARGNGLQVAFALPTGADARFELLDVSGRRVLVREVGTLGPGRHTVNLATSRNVAPGLYWLRLSQGANQRTTRVTVIE